MTRHQAGDPVAVILRREYVVRTAREWIGTPYHHQASVRGVGADCLGLLRGIWREIYGTDAEVPPAYTRDWAEAHGREELIAGAGRHLCRIAIADIRPGDVLVFRLRGGMAAKHVGVVATETTFIHALEGARTCEVALASWWRRRIAAAYSFPGVVD
jgi:NlpC/P60 family putative phage cell wall peptidase